MVTQTITITFIRRRNNNLFRWNKKRLQIVQMLAVGETNQDIMQAVSMEPSNFYKELKKPDMIQAIEKAKTHVVEQAISTLKSNTGYAAKGIISLSKQARSENVRLQACQDILDRAGVPKTNETISTIQPAPGIKMAWGIMKDTLSQLQTQDEPLQIEGEKE